MLLKPSYFAAVCAVALGMTQAIAHADTRKDGNIIEAARWHGLTTFVAAVEAAGLTQTLESAGPYTVFAPTNDAFAALPQGTLDELLANPTELANILLYHVVSGDYNTMSLGDYSGAFSVQGCSITFTPCDGHGLQIDQAMLVGDEIRADNGVIHPINGVLTPACGGSGKTKSLH
jgi:uncharacterized surface protein with fasciclin (FAS1) repeats